MAAPLSLSFTAQPNQVVPFTMVIFQGNAAFEFSVDASLLLNSGETVSTATTTTSNTALTVNSSAVSTPLITVVLENAMLPGDTSSMYVAFTTNMRGTQVVPFRVASGPGVS